MDNQDLKMQHGGDIELAIKKYGGARENWIDLSTGINGTSYPWQQSIKVELRNLPSNKLLVNLEQAAATAYKVAENKDTAAISGAQQIINLLPICLKSCNSVAILGPTYNEYEKAFKNSSIKTQIVSEVSRLSSSDIAIIVNPNNPTGKVIADEALDELSKKVRILIIDESFKMFSSRRTQKFNNIIQINSLGKFFGLAGVRLGFVSGPSDFITTVKAILGPWPVSTLAAEIGIVALNDKVWISEMEKMLVTESNMLHEACSSKNWDLIGKTSLFHTYATSSCLEVEKQFAAHGIWIRTFDYSETWVRLGIPTSENEWTRVKRALNQ
ncbi:aminotransferase class I/II-fold pyridoxal phosphate-dependent enzyme [Paracoccaceae bacterium]|nr:aminotransferase class I/II-fold pyridoxal phosphate-dependent enzyme [Paracoccaceae bacterium]